MDRMREIMATLRSQPPATLGGLPVTRVRDYGSLTTSAAGTAGVPFAGAKGDLVMFDLAEPAAPATSLPASDVAAGRFPALANCVAARPSGTEPKIKFYLFAAAAPCGHQQLAATKSALVQRLDLLERDLRSLAGV
jgi:phosphoglucomutase/phosphomannomutase